MSDEPPPPKPKPGSLRDRIAAFENKSASSPTPGPPPIPRPKPGGLTWKPKLPSPPTSPGSPGDHGPSSPERKHSGGMSASDAKESIGKGGSLKERMAALQGKGAFGAPPPLSPKPAIEKPQWKPPPVVSPPAEDPIKDDTPHEPVTIPTEAERDPALDDETRQDAGDLASPENDPEEEERQRRANIAARMARLGGARVGMAPPVFGRKPPVNKETKPKEGVSEVQTPKEEVNPSVENAAVDPIGERKLSLCISLPYYSFTLLFV